MEDGQKTERRRRIEDAALEVLGEVGFKKASMLQIAKRAKASNETLYAWYGSKQALFSAIIEENSKILKTALEDADLTEDTPAASLEKVGQLLLAFTATEKAVIVNRAAVADVGETGLLAAAIEAHAREPILQRLSVLMARFERIDRTGKDDGPDGAIDTFISLLFGELQMQQALGAIAPLTANQIEDRSRTAVARFLRLFAMQSET